MVKERRGLSTTAHARAHCTMPSVKHSFDGQQRVAGPVAIGHLRGMVGAGAIGQQRMVGADAIGHPQRMGGSWCHRATACGGSCCHRAPAAHGWEMLPSGNSGMVGAVAIGQQRTAGAVTIGQQRMEGAVTIGHLQRMGGRRCHRAAAHSR